MTKEKLYKPENELKKFAVTYEIDYVHRVVVGVTAINAESAQQMAETAFNEATIWDSKDMPLLFDDYEELGGETLLFSTEEVSEFPKPDSSVIAIKQKESAFHACRMLLDGETNSARNFAKKALPISAGQDPYQELNHHLDQSYLIELIGQEPDLKQFFMDSQDTKWADIKELVETQATMAFKLGRPISENEFDYGSWQRKWFMDKYLAQQSYVQVSDEDSMKNRLWKLRDALEQVRAALPDICFAKQEEIDPDLIMHINSVLNSNDNFEEFKRVLMEAKSALPMAWSNHGGVARELLQLIDLAIRM